MRAIRKQGLKVGIIASSSLLILAMGSAFASAKVTKSAAAIPKLHWKGTITMYAASYTPVVPGEKLAKDSIRLTELETLAKQFEKMYPGITIKFIPKFTDSDQQVETMSAGGTMYDVYWNLYQNWNAVFPSGIVYNLNQYLNQPNPYIPGNKAWKDVMSPRVLEQSVSPSGDHFEVDGDWVGTAFYFNKTLFAKAGIASPPKTWQQLISDAKQLTAHHIIAGADVPQHYSWWSRLFLGNDLGLSTLNQLEAYSKDKFAVTSLGEVIGYEKGIFNPAKNPRIMAWWPLVKELYSYWDKNVTDLPWNAIPTGAQTGTDLFAAGKVAMMYGGSWVPNTVKAAGAKFPIGSFAFPAASLGSAFKYGTAVNSAADVGGPSGSFEFGISTPAADHSMSQPGKFQAVLDWLRYVSTPQHNQAIVNELGEYVPTFKGTIPLKSELGALPPKGSHYVSVEGFADVTAQSHTQIGSLFQEYVSGHISLAVAKQQFDTIAQQAVQQYIATNHPHIP